MTRPDSSTLDTRVDHVESPYRSRGETQVGRFFDRYGIPFLYEHPTVLYDRGRRRVWHPDFTLPTYNGLIVEYAGMMDIPDYAAGIRHKEKAYCANGLRALFVYPQDLTGPKWTEELVGKIEKANG